MIDAEIPEGDLTQITLAIQNALKPNSTIITQRLAAQPPVRNSSSNTAEVEPDLQEEAIDMEVETPAEVETNAIPREPRNRKPTVPKVLELDLTSEISLESFTKNTLHRTRLNVIWLSWRGLISIERMSLSR
jgi:hypothetical protein